MISNKKMISDKYVDMPFDLFFIAFGSWTILDILFYFCGLSFSILVTISIFVVPFICWCAAGKCYSYENCDYIQPNEMLMLCLFIVAAVIVTICLNRPDADDQQYLGTSILVLNYADIPIRSLLSHYGIGYAFPSDRLLKSALSYFTGLPILTSYYLVLPAFYSILVIVAYYKLLNLLIQKRWVVGIAFLFIIMFAWGDVHRTYANFGFVRLFQGKACLVSFVVPAIIYYYIRYIETEKYRNLLLLSMALISGVGFSATGIIVGPLTLCFLALANFKIKSNMRSQIVLVSCLAVPILLGILIRYYFGIHRAGVHTIKGVQESTTNYEMIKFVFGNGYRGVFALLCFMVSPLFVTHVNGAKNVYGKYVLLGIVLLAIPWTSELIAWSTYPTASWRWMWALPISLSMCIVMGRISDIKLNLKKIDLHLGYIFVILLSLLYVYSADRIVVSHKNYTTFTWPSYKLAHRNKVWLRRYREFASIKDGYILLPKSNKKY